MDSIDKLLSELKAEYQQPVNSQTGEVEEVEQVKKNQKANFDSSSPSSSTFTSPQQKGDAIDNILAEVKQDFEEKELLEQQQKQREVEQERIRQEEIKAKQIEALKNQAKAWLEKLDPLSPEGLWFESFAKSYPSKLEAAIEYLKANIES